MGIFYYLCGMFRIYEVGVYKMMKHDTLKTLELFERIRIFNPKILNIMFGRGMWLKPTTEL